MEIMQAYKLRLLFNFSSVWKLFYSSTCIICIVFQYKNISIKEIKQSSNEIKQSEEVLSFNTNIAIKLKQLISNFYCKKLLFELCNKLQ